MPRPKHTKPALDAPAVEHAKADRAFPRKSKTHPVLTHERIAADMADFRKAGGRIEVLGVTRTLTKAHADDASSPSRQQDPAPTKPARTKKK